MSDVEKEITRIRNMMGDGVPKMLYCYTNDALNV